jgi:dGTPase
MSDINHWEERRELWQSRGDDARTAYEVDLARILHSSSFRRLGAVTQVISGEGSLQRTRLTHSLEVQQIAEGIVQRFRILPDLPDVLRTHLTDSTLIRTIALTHDLGHPPFGHAGEEALNCMMRDRSAEGVPTAGHTLGFEGNGQTIRILSRLEDFSETAGANLTRRSLLGTLKYPVPYSQALKEPVPPPLLTETGVPMITEGAHAPPKCYLDSERSVVAWLLEPLGEAQARSVVEGCAKSVDASLMDRSDDLAYSFADLQDAITLDLIRREHLMEDIPAHLWDDYIDYSAQRGDDELFGDGTGYDRVIRNLFKGSKSLQKQIGRLMGYGMARTRIRERPQFSDPLYAWEIDLDPKANALVEAVKRCILERVILSPRLQHGRLQGQMMLVKIFDVMRNDPRHQLPEKQYRRYSECERDDRVICDWLAGSSEEFVRKLYQRVFTPGAASVTDRL